MQKKTRVFVGSASEELIFAHAIQAHFVGDDKIEIVPWDQHFKTPPNTEDEFLSILRLAVKTCELAVFIVAPDSPVAPKKERPVLYRYSTNANVWFEYGMFVSSRGSSSVIPCLAVPKGVSEETVQWPSDLGGRTKRIFHRPKLPPNYDYIAKTSKNGLCDFKKATKRPTELALKAVEEIVENIKAKVSPDREYEFVEFLTSKECKERGEMMILSAGKESPVFTILAWEGGAEPQPNSDERTLDSAIRQRIENQRDWFARSYEYDGFDHLKGHFSSATEISDNDRSESDKKAIKVFDKCQQFCVDLNKRWINVNDEDLFEVAKSLANGYGGFIQIRDTHCRVVEAVVVENEALILFPMKDNISQTKQNKIAFGFYVSSPLIGQLLPDWFNSYLPNGYGVDFDSPDALEDYRKIKWPSTDRRISEICSACLGGYKRIVDIEPYAQVRTALSRIDANRAEAEEKIE